MSKYNLSDILNEYIGGGRIGTLKISFKDLQDKMDELEDSGKVIVRTLSGPSGDGKVNREFEVVDRDSAVPGGNKQERGFTVYDYKFGFDPGSEDKFMNEYPFSVGGNDLKLAMELIDGVEEYKFEESINEENVIKDLAQADEVIKMIKMMNPDVRADLLMRIARMGQKMDENRREKNPVGMGQLYVQPAVQKEIKRQLDAYDKGDMDVDDLINGIEEIIFGYVKAPGMNESTGPSDKAETEDDVVNIDKVAGPSAKGVGYGAETSANTAEDDMEDKEVANPRPMYENGDVGDFTSELKEDDLEEDVYGMRRMQLDKAAKKLQDGPLKGIPTDIVIDFIKTHIKDIRGASDEEIRDEFEEFRSVNYDYIDEDLKKQFKRFM
tara:strand:- start:30 stop:1172 length:1143 start_codon:yes stop_codon:yes gene_type:complete